VIASRPLEATRFKVDRPRWAYVSYGSGLSINVLCTIEETGKRALADLFTQVLLVAAHATLARFETVAIDGTKIAAKWLPSQPDHDGCGQMPGLITPGQWALGRGAGIGGHHPQCAGFRWERGCKDSWPVPR